MPRDLDDDEPIAEPKAKRKPARDPNEPGGALKPLLITVGCIAVAFAGIMAFVLMKAPKAGDVAIGDPPTGNRIPNPNDPKPNPGDPNAPQPDDWTPSKAERRRSAMTGRPSFFLQEDKTLPPQTLGWVREGEYLEGTMLLFATTSNGELVGYDVKARAALPRPSDLKAGERVGNVSATAGAEAVYAKGSDRVFRYNVYGRQWSSAPLGGYGGCLAVSSERFLVYESRFADTQFRLYKWPLGSATATLSAKWEVAGGVAAVTYDGQAGELWVARAKNFDATTGDLDRFALTGQGGKLLSSTPLPFKVGITSRPVVSPDGRRVFVEDRAVQNDRLLPVTFPGQVVAAVGEVALMGNGEFADANSGAVIGKAWDKQSLSALAFNDTQTACWAYDFAAKTYRRYSVVLGGKLPTDPPNPPTDPNPPITPKPKPAVSVKVTELASVPGSAISLSVLKYSDKHDLLLYTETAGTIVLDAKTGQPLPPPKLEGKARLRAMDLAPDQVAAFATDGQNLHRLDLAARKWDTKPFVGTRVLALDGDTAMVQVRPSNPATWAVVKWDGNGPKEVGQMEWPYLYELGYDPTAKALYALYSKTNTTLAAVLERYARDGDGFKSEGSKKFAGAAPGARLRPLTTDGKFFLQSMKGVPTDLKADATVSFNESLVGSVGEWAVGGSGQLYAVESGQLVGALPTASDAIAPTADGSAVWVFNRTGRKFVKYRIDAVKK